MPVETLQHKQSNFDSAIWTPGMHSQVSGTDPLNQPWGTIVIIGINWTRLMAHVRRAVQVSRCATLTKASTHAPIRRLVRVLAHPSRNQRLIYSSICRHSFISIPVHPSIDLSSIDLWIQRIYPTIPISLRVRLSVYPSFRQTISRSLSLSIYPSHYLSRYSWLSAQRLVHKYQKRHMFWHATSLLQDLDIIGNVRLTLDPSITLSLAISRSPSSLTASSASTVGSSVTRQAGMAQSRPIWAGLLGYCHCFFF